jgi:hypothetical protein
MLAARCRIRIRNRGIKSRNARVSAIIASARILAFRCRLYVRHATWIVFAALKYRIRSISRI